ncbi:cysteine desulfurase-like protein [Naumannella cuiyingiana]|uniref:cysteine desulfurase-like protein n=1 Tax=Naumannella cuiyingiana TaxID=1347891 RepID=UPI0015C83FB8|nr:cysteine desulfurase-like protein [Naumannella cuiyingiana]
MFAVAYHIERIRSEIPALAGGPAFFDSPGGTQLPAPVIEAMVAAMSAPLSNRTTLTEGGRNAERITIEARAAMADLLGAAPERVVFGRSATMLTFDLARTLAFGWAPGDEVVVTRLDHDGNIRPWVIAAERAGATVRFCDFDPESGELTPQHLRKVVTEDTVLVALPGASNLIGTVPDLPALVRIGHEVAAHVHIDAVHLAAHRRVDLAALGADTLTTSPYKLCGPHLGVLTAAPDAIDELRPDKLLPSPDIVPERFELGTLPYELLAGLPAVADWLAGLDDAATGTRSERLDVSLAAAEQHEDALAMQLLEALPDLPGVTNLSRAADRTPTTLLIFDEISAAEVAQQLAGERIQAPAGHFYAWEASHRLGLRDAGGLRIGFAPYNDAAEVERLVRALATATS